MMKKKEQTLAVTMVLCLPFVWLHNRSWRPTAAGYKLETWSPISLSLLPDKQWLIKTSLEKQKNFPSGKRERQLPK